MLRAINIDEQVEMLRTELKNTGSEAKIKKYAKRLKVLEAFQRSASSLTDGARGSAGAAAGTEICWCRWMRRPLRDVGPGNDLYRRVINRNNRLKLLELKAPEIIVRNGAGCCRKLSI